MVKVWGKNQHQRVIFGEIILKNGVMFYIEITKEA